MLKVHKQKFLARTTTAIATVALLLGGIAISTGSATAASPPAIAQRLTLAKPRLAKLTMTFPQDTAQALRIADFILSLENANGAIADSPGAATSNNDSNAEYALMGLAAAYSYSRTTKYLTGFEHGLTWLAAREDMKAGIWRGSWYLQYSSRPPYAEVPAPSNGGRIVNVRGVDATSSLFVYLLYLDQRLTGNSTLVRQYSNNAQAALNFVVNRNADTTTDLGHGLFYGSWLLGKTTHTWSVYKEEYADDQGDDYLGFHAGALLYNKNKYGAVATTIKRRTPAVIWNTKSLMYATGLSGNVLDNSLDGYDEGMSQGYLAWMWGNTTKDQDGMTWLRRHVLHSGAIQTDLKRPAYSLNIGLLGMGDASLGAPAPSTSFAYLVNTAQDTNNGGVHDTLNSTDLTEYDNVAGFSILGLLGFQAF